MAKFLSTLFSFSNGELNSRLLGRTDIKEYYASGKELTNFSIAPQGGVNQLRGSLWLSREATTSPFDFTFQEKYAVLFDSSSIILGELKLEPSSNGYYLDKTTLSGTLPSNYTSSFEYGTHVSINNTVIVTDSRGIVEPIVIRKINGVWKVQTWSLYAQQVGPLADTTTERLWKSRPMSSYVLDTENFLTLLGTTLTSTFDIFSSGMVGSYITLSDGATDYVVKVDSYTSATEVEVSDIEGAAPDGDYELYKLPVWYDGSWPKIVSYFQGRVLFANTEANFDTIWNSVSGNLVRMAEPLEQDTLDPSDAFLIQPNTTNSTPISWIVTERYITAGTHTSEYVIQGLEGQYTSALSTISEVSRYGSSSKVGLAFRAQASTYFVERDNKTIRELSFSEENGGYTSRNVGLLGPEISRVNRMAYDYPNKRIYVETPTTIYMLTIDISSGVLGWSKLSERATMSGILSIDEEILLLYKSYLDFDSVALVFYTESDLYPHNESGTLYYPIGSKITTIKQSPQVGDDYALSANDYSTAVPGQTIQVFDPINEVWKDTTLLIASGHGTFLDGTMYITEPDFVPQIVCKSSEQEARLETTPIQTGSSIGDAQVAYQRIDKAGIRLFKSRQGFTAGTSESNLEEIELDGEYTGIKEANLDGCPENDHSVILKNNSIWPIVLLSISARGLASEG